MPTAVGTQAIAPTATRSHLRWIVVVAVAARVLLTAFYFRSNHVLAPGGLGYENVSIALALLAGRGFSSPFFFPSGPTAFMPPGYPVLIAGFMRVLGTGIAATIGLTAFQILLSVVTVVVVQKAARRYLGMRTGNLAGLFCALAEPFLIAPLYIWDTCLSALILVAAIAVAPDIRRRRDFALAGLGCAIAVLINSALLFPLLGIIAWAAWRARTTPWLAFLVFAIAFSPWPIRNFATMHAFIPLRSNLGYELWHGNPGSDGETPAFSTPGVNAREHSLYVSEGEVGYMREKGSLAKAWIAMHPAEFARLTGRRFIRFWTGSSRSPAPMTASLSVAAFIGLALLWRSRPLFVLFAIPLALFPLPYYITHPDVRFQFVIDPLLAILAGYACESFFAWCARRPAPSPEVASDAGN